VWRARIVLLSAAGVGTMAIQRQTGKGKPTIWRWQARFMAEGVDGLLHEATRPAGKPPLLPATIERVVAMTLCCAAIRMRRRIASPEMFPEAPLLPHLICSRPMFIGGVGDEADQHGNA
jgi:hypothetical protein